MPPPLGGGGSGGVGAVEGWEFTVSREVTVAGLGVLDDAASAGLNEEHPIAIWNSAQQILAMATVPAGTAAPLVNGFRYVPIGKLNLVPGMNYTVGAFFPEPREDDVVGSATLPLEPQITLVRGRRLPFVDSLAFPTTLGSPPQIGPGLLFEFEGCGNGALDEGEQCDDGNAIADDCCSAACEIIAGPACRQGDACLGDCNHDEVTGVDDLARIRAILLACGPCPGGGVGGVAQGCAAVAGADKQCAAADFNGDGCLSAAELTRVIANVLADPATGCPSEEDED
jgi:cysteine-rich repeat protein